MDCSEVQSRLSAYHDSELSPDVAAQVAAHLATCRSCAGELASFKKLSGLSRKLTDPPLPNDLWEELQSRLRPQTRRWAILGQWKPRSMPSRAFALAASLLIALGIWQLSEVWFSGHGHDHHLAVNFAHFLEEFAEKPEAAQQVFLAKYNGRPASLDEAAEVLGYQPLAARSLPPDYAFDQAYILDMPCCTCAQIVCKNDAGQSIAIFEHDIDQPVWFGDNPSMDCLCHDVPTSVVQVGDRLAATWKEGKRYVTVIGATDLDEVTSFVAHFRGDTISR